MKKHAGLKICTIILTVLFLAAVAFWIIYSYQATDSPAEEIDDGLDLNMTVTRQLADENGIVECKYYHQGYKPSGCDNLSRGTYYCEGHLFYQNEYGEFFSYYPARRILNMESATVTGDINSKMQVSVIFDESPVKEETYFNRYPTRIEIIASNGSVRADNVSITENFYYSAGYSDRLNSLDVSYLYDYFAASYGVKDGADYYDYIVNDLGDEYGYNLSGGSYTYGFRSDYVSDDGEVYKEGDYEYSKYAYVGYTQEEVETNKKMSVEQNEASSSSRLVYNLDESEFRDGFYTLCVTLDGNEFKSSFYLDTDSLWDEATAKENRWYSWDDAPMGRVVRYASGDGIEFVQNCDFEYIWYYGDPSRVAVYRDAGCGFETMQIYDDISFGKYNSDTGYYVSCDPGGELYKVMGYVEEGHYPYDGVYMAEENTTMCMAGNIFPTANPGYAVNGKHLVTNFVGKNAVGYAHNSDGTWSPCVYLDGLFYAYVKEKVVLTDLAGNEHTCNVSVVYLDYWLNEWNYYYQSISIR